MDCSTPGFPVHHQLVEPAQTRVHRVSDAIQPSHPLSSPFPPAFNLSQHQGLFQWVGSSNQVVKLLEFQLHHQSFQWMLYCAVLSHVWLLVSPWTVAHQGTLSVGFPRQEYWSGLPFPSPGDLSNSGIKPRSPALQTDSLPSEPPGKPFLQQRTSTSFFINLYLSKHLFNLSHYLPHLSTNHFPCELQSLPLCFYNHRRQ